MTSLTLICNIILYNDKTKKNKKPKKTKTQKKAS